MNNSAWLLLADCVQLATWLVNLKLKEVKFGWTILKNSFTFDIYGVQCTFCIVFEVDLEKIPKIEHSNRYILTVWIFLLIRAWPENWDQIGLWEYYVTKYHSAANRANREAKILSTHWNFPFFGRFFAFNRRKILLFPNFLKNTVYFQKKTCSF